MTPLPGATATLSGESIYGERFLGLDATSGSDGWYRFRNVPVGIYTVTASMSGQLFIIGGWSGITVRDHDVVLADLAAVAITAP